MKEIKTEGVIYKGDKNAKEVVMHEDQFLKLRKVIITAIEKSDEVQFQRELNTIMRLKHYKTKNQHEYMEVFRQG